MAINAFFIWRREVAKNETTSQEKPVRGKLLTVSEADESGEYHEEKVVCAENKMPYAVDGQAYGYLGSAGRAFLKKLKEGLDIKIPELEPVL
jgi:hypothetical protein